MFIFFSFSSREFDSEKILLRDRDEISFTMFGGLVMILHSVAMA